MMILPQIANIYKGIAMRRSKLRRKSAGSLNTKKL